MHGGDGVFRRGDKVEVLPLHPVHDGLEVLQVHDTLVRSASHGERGQDGLVPPLPQEVQGVPLQGQVQADQVPPHVEEAGARHLPAAFKVRQPRSLQQLPVHPQVEVRDGGLPPPSQLHVLRVVRPHGDVRVQDVGKVQKGAVDGFPGGLEVIGEGLDLLPHLNGLLHEGFRVLPLLPGGGHLPGELVPPVAELVYLRGGLPPLGVPGDELLQEGELLLVPALLKVLADHLWLLADETDVQHDPLTTDEAAIKAWRWPRTRWASANEGGCPTKSLRCPRPAS